MNEQEKGFVIKDRRSLDEKGDLKDTAAREEKKEDRPKTEAPKKEAQRPPLPEVNFTSLIFSLSSSALYNFGEIADPESGEKKVDLPLAKHAVDTIAMLKEKTEGNRTDEENKFLESVLTDLRWRYVRAAK
jgi:hypothetical protein